MSVMQSQAEGMSSLQHSEYSMHLYTLHGIKLHWVKNLPLSQKKCKSWKWKCDPVG